MERGAPVRAVCRSIAALQAINRHGSLTLIEIAKHIDLPYPTACRIVQTLIYEGLIECEPTRKRYRAAPLVQSLSMGFQGDNDTLPMAHPLLAALTQKVCWPVGLTTRAGSWMIVRDSTHSISSLTFHNYHPGYTFPILESACGHAYLAHASEQERAAVLAEIAETEGRSLILSMFESGQLVERIRDDGYASHDRNRHTQSPGKTSSVSVPVFEGGRIASALTLTFFASSMPMADAVRRFVPEMQQVAAAIGACATAERARRQTHDAGAALAVIAQQAHTDAGRLVH